MEGTTLKEELQGFVKPRDIERKAGRLGVVERRRAVCVVSLVIALVLTGGEDERRGRLSSVYEEYQAMESVDAVGRSGFNARFDEGMSALLVWIVWEALERAKAQPVVLRGILSDVPGGIEDWLLVDSETVRLHSSTTRAKALGLPVPGCVRKRYRVKGD